MNLYVVSLYYQVDRVTGANKRFDELGRRLLCSKKLAVTFVVAKGHVPPWIDDKESVIEIDYSPSLLGRFAAFFNLSIKLDSLPPGIVYSDFSPPPFLSARKHKLVQLIHDLRGMTEYKGSRFNFGKGFIQRLILKKCTNIITVSQSTKDILNQNLSISKQKIFVSYNGVNDLLFDYPLDVERPIDILYVATFEARKNHMALVEACRFCEGSNLNVTFVGRDLGLKAQVINSIASLPKNVHIQIIESVQEQQLHDLYHDSKVFVMPSLLEGFGMPLVEAGAAGCRLICTDLPVFREVCGSNAVYVNSTKPDDIFDALTSQLKSSKPLENEFFKRYSWDSIVSELEAYFLTIGKCNVE